MHWVRWGVLVAALLLAASCSSGVSTTPSPGTPQTTQLTVPPGGTLRVIVTLAGSFVPEGELVDAAALDRLLRSQRVVAVLEDTAQSQNG
ncbi:hypothetical protein [Kribbella sp. NPDC051718]|uniref:hypothetical protein n=1 Tax=Kribbella sp. NPDC051718 TaxID=3155168 RepID=UPI0034437202